MLKKKDRDSKQNVIRVDLYDYYSLISAYLHLGHLSRLLVVDVTNNA